MLDSCDELSLKSREPLSPPQLGSWSMLDMLYQGEKCDPKKQDSPTLVKNKGDMKSTILNQLSSKLSPCTPSHHAEELRPHQAQQEGEGEGTKERRQVAAQVSEHSSLWLDYPSPLPDAAVPYC